MGTTLTGTTPQDTYDSLIKVTDNGPLSGSLKKLTDGLGNDSALSLSTGAASITGTLAVTTGTNLATSSGSVGIGLSSPTAKLEIQDGPAGAAVKVSNSGGGSAQLAISSNATSVATLSFSNSLSLTGGNVGIGTSSPAAKLSVIDTASFTGGTNYSTPHLLISGNSSYTSGNVTRLAFAINGDGNQAYIDCISTNSGGNSSDLAIRTRGGGGVGERVRILANGGLTFNGDTAAANALDDYEEGTWTIGISFGGASVGVTYSNNTGTYTKIGRQVTVNGYISLTSKGSSTGTARITGLPFTIGSSTSFFSAASLWMYEVSFANQFQAYGELNGSQILLSEITEAGANTFLTNADFTNASEVLISYTYFV